MGTFSVQLAPSGKGAVGVKVTLVTLLVALLVKVTEVLLHVSAMLVGTTVTASLNSKVTVWLIPTTAALAGVLLASTVGATSTVVKVEVKSAAMVSGGSLLSWSVTWVA
ncbi:MAG: hypothetical protein R3F37_01540 [Candidatus Competibacteraceae bacterium]